MEEIDPRRLLIQVSKILERLNIPYAITGGMAVFVWARPRFTADIDIVVLLKATVIPRLVGALRELGEAGYVSEEMMHHALERHGEFNFVDGVTGVKVDFFVIGDRPFDQSQLERRVAQSVLGNQIYFVSPEDLVLSKLLWFREGGSAKQREDVESILKMQKNLDWNYLEKWAIIHKTIEILNELRESKLG